ncbi:MAG: DUF1289 domain-containing protein [Pseudomonadota bacterium]
MTDHVWKRPEVDSPCIRICQIHPETRLCIGCARSIDEIGRWSSMSPEDRAAVMAELPTRRTSPGRRGGRKGRQTG